MAKIIYNNIIFFNISTYFINYKSKKETKSMASKELSSSLKEVSNNNNNNPNKTKLFLNNLKHHRNLSTTLPAHPNFISSKKLFSQQKEIDKNQSRSTLFTISSNALQQISSYGTNNKSKVINDTNEKEKEKRGSKKILFVSKETEMVKLKDTDKKQKTKRRKSKSQKFLLSKIQNINSNNINNQINEDISEIIIYNKNDICDKAENYLSIPDDLNEKLKKPILSLISPSNNIEGNYSHYINDVADSLIEFIEFDYDSIFNEENKNNVKYLYYTSPMDIDDVPKKKLLLIDLDETLIHSEFRNKDNFKALDLFTKNSKCLTKTFSYSDDNYVYFIDVFFRPYLKDFLNEVSKYFDLAIFTAAMKGYADTIIDYIDPKNEYFQFRLYRDACIPIQQRLYIKDLRIIKDYDPMNVILMDNSLYSFMNQPSNGMLVNSFYTNHKDTQLISAKNFLVNHILPCNDVRKECEKWYHFTNLFYKGTSKEVKED